MVDGEEQINKSKEESERVSTNRNNKEEKVLVLKVAILLVSQKHLDVKQIILEKNKRKYFLSRREGK